MSAVSETFKQTGRTWNAEPIIKAAIPDAPDWLLEHIIWGRTPYPFTTVTPKMVYKAASSYKRANDNGIRLCDHCERPATEHFCCDVCNKALSDCANRTHAY